MMKNVKVRTRLLIGFAAMLALLIFVSIFSATRMFYLAEFTTDLYNLPLTVSNAVRDAEINIVNMQRLMREMMLAETGAELEEAVKTVNEYEERVNGNFTVIKDNILKKDKSEIYRIRKSFLDWKPIREEEISFLRQNDKLRAVEILKAKGLPAINRLTADLKSLSEFAAKKADGVLASARQSEKNAYLVVAIVDILAVIISLLIAYWITLSITRPVDIALGIADRLSQGDIAVEIPDYSRDEMGRMLESMKQMAGNLREQMREIREGISVIAGSTAEISTTTAQLASTTQEVAASVNQVVVSMKEVKQTTELSNEKAREMTERARSVVQTSRSGESAVQQTIDLINAIQEQMISIADSVVGLSDQGQSIGEIIAAVDDVADQSRLLAVNASIEAVKAGEQGKGFTVVADEIKSLAEQSKLSTSQVRTILTDIQKATAAAVMATEKGSKAVENGVKQAGQTGGAIRTLGENINQTAQAAAQIEATSRQQSAGIDQVFSAMESIGGAITQNAENARQLEKSAYGLDQLGKKLKAIVQKYNV